MKTLKVVAALDSFKGSISSREAGEAVRRGVLARVSTAEVTVFPVGDGGEGTAEALMQALGAETQALTVSDTHRSPISATVGCTNDTAIFDMAAAAGIGFAKSHGLDLLRSTTAGVGEIIRTLVQSGCRKIVIGLGGSGTSDGGIGALETLGAQFFDAQGSLLTDCCTETLEKIRSCDLSAAQKFLHGVEITLLYDAAVPLTGENGAVRMFSRQKGADDAMIPQLDQAMIHYSAVCDAAVGRKVSDFPGAGAAGGLGYGLSLLGAKLTPGAQFVLDAIGFSEAARSADLIITGEGKTDNQTVTGKLPMIVAQKSCSKPVVCLCGVNDAVPALYESGISAVFALADRPMSAEESIKRTAELLEKAAYNLTGLLYN